MKTMLKQVCTVFVLCCLLLSLLACAKELPESAKGVVSTKAIKYTSDGSATFKIVRAELKNSEVGPVAIEIFKKYKEIHNVAPKQVLDTEATEDGREILIGDCDRDATRKAKEILAIEGTGKESDYIICSIGDDIVIYGGCVESQKTAGQYFIKHFLKKTQEDGIFYLHKGKENGMTVCNVSELSKFTVVRPIYNVSYITQTETDKLCDLLYEKTGYEVPIVHDNVSKNHEDVAKLGGVLEQTKATEYEIIIGDCDREGVNKISLSDQYEIRIEDKKIYLNGGSPYATAMAVSEFIKMVESNKVIDKSMSVTKANYKDAIQNYDTKTYYKPVWWDEFNGTEIDTKKWNVTWGARGGTAVDGKPCYRGSKELKNNYVENGNLVIAAAKTEDAYYGGMLKTDRSMEFLYGYLEISDIHPYGNGFWTALWTVSKSNRYNKDMWHSETDVDEAFGSGYSIVGNLWAWPTNYGRNQLNLHNGRSDTVKDHGGYTSDDPRGLWMDFHTYGLEWIDCKTVRFTIDGYVWRETVMEAPELQTAYSQYMYLKVSMATAFETMGAPTEDEWKWENTNKFIVDWVYLYQLEGHEIKKY